MTENDVDPRPELTITMVGQAGVLPLPPTLANAPDAHHRYRAVERQPPGDWIDDQSHLTLLWLPNAPSRLGQLGVHAPHAVFRSDSRILVVLSNSARRPAHELDSLEREIRQRLSDLGVPGDDIPFVQHGVQYGVRAAGALAHGRAEWKNNASAALIVDAINRWGRPIGARQEGPFFAHAEREYDPPMFTTPHARPPRPFDFFASIRLLSGRISTGDSMWMHDVTSQQVTIAKLFLKDSLTHAYREVDALDTFEKGYFYLTRPLAPSNAYRWALSDGSVHFTSQLSIKLTAAWSNGACDVTHLQELRKRLPRSMQMHAPHSLRPADTTSFELSAGPRGVEARITTTRRIPVCPGPIFLVEHGTGAIVRGEQQWPDGDMGQG